MLRRELATARPMSRVAIVAPEAHLRDVLAALADSGAVEVAGALPSAEGEALEALRRLERAGRNGRCEPQLASGKPDVGELERGERRDLLAGEVELLRRAQAARRHGGYAALVGWAPTDGVEPLTSRLAAGGGALVELSPPARVEPPTLLRSARGARAFRGLVDTYGALRYRDVDPTPFAVLAFVVMFGMMFGDVGHGAMLAGLGLWLRTRTEGRFAGLRPLWPFAVAAGAAAAVFGLLYGEAFGPSGLAPVLWLEPLEKPVELLSAAIAVGAVLLAASYALGTVNRWREGGSASALLAPSGIGGFLVFAGLGLVAGGWYAGLTAATVVGAAAAVVGVLLLGLGFQLEAGRGAAAVTQAAIEVVDAVVRVFANLVSFARLAAFGLMHAALAAVVLAAAGALWGGPLGIALAALVFALGTLLTFGLEALVAGVQALRLEYYELFSRVFAGEGHTFAPWHIPLEKESS